MMLWCVVLFCYVLLCDGGESGDGGVVGYGCN